tara:strand:+ start:7050 stop:7379 length:330 start_codon:yes stop_codon:yes gene_type:complete
MYELAFKSHDIQSIANSLKLAGIGNYYTGDLEKCQENFKKSVSLFNSDGFHDQLSSTKKVSFGMEKFENLLKKTSLNDNDKNEFLENEFNEWKGNFLQLDDLLIVAFQI